MPVFRTRDTQFECNYRLRTPRALLADHPSPDVITDSSRQAELTLTPSSQSLPRSFSLESPASSSSFSTTLSSAAASIPLSDKSPTANTCRDVERRQRKGAVGYIKRPPNAFILFRCQRCVELRQEGASAQRQAHLSKTISQEWKALSSEARLYWKELAREKKKEHKQMYPNYVYRPQRSKDKKGKFVVAYDLPLTAPTTTSKHGSSVSEPADAGETVQFLSALMPSCTNTPPFVPMINQPSPHSGHDHATYNPFDFTDDNGFLQGMFDDPFAQSSLPIPPGMFDEPFALPSLSISPGMPMLPPTEKVSPSSSVASDSPCPPSPDAGSLTSMEGRWPYIVQSYTPPFFAGTHIDHVPTTGGPVSDVPCGYAPPSLASWKGGLSWITKPDLQFTDEFDVNAISPSLPTSMPFDAANPLPMRMDARATQ